MKTNDTMKRIKVNLDKAQKALDVIQKDFVQVTEPNPEELAEIVKAIIGDTPLREFGAKAGLSASTLSRIINGKILKPMSAETLLNIVVSSDVDEARHVDLYRELARANGMMSRSEQQVLQRHMELRKQREELHGSVKQMISTVVLARLAERGVGIHSDEGDDAFDVAGGYIRNITELGIRYDFRLDLESETEKYAWVLWAFPQSEDDYSDGSFNPRALANQLMRELSPVFLADSWKPDLYAEAKLTFCFVDWQLFECFCHLLDGAKLNNRFSAILIDSESLYVKEERVFESADYPDSESLFDLPPVMSITQDNDDVAGELTGNDFLIFEDEGEE